MKKLLAPLEQDREKQMFFWVILFLVIEFGFTWFMEWMVLGQAELFPASLDWETTGFSALLSLVGLLLARAILVFSRKKTAKKEGWWILAGIISAICCFRVQLPSGLSSQNTLELIYFLLEEVLPWLFAGCCSALLLIYGGLLSALLFVWGSLFWMNSSLPMVEQSPLLVLLRALLPLVFLMVLNIDLSEEEQQEKEKGKPETSSIKKALAWTANGLLIGFVSLILLFGIGLLPWIPTAIATGSMQPSLMVGDLAVVDTTRKVPEEGDVISYESQGVSVVHRVIEVREEDGETVWITKGDNNADADPDPVYADQIEGIVSWSIPKAGWLTLWMHAS